MAASEALRFDRWNPTINRTSSWPSTRASIDNIDAALVHLLAERFKVTPGGGGENKAAVGMPPADLEREALQVQRLRDLAENAGWVRCSVRSSCGS
ncbi:MAG: hypothetical protein CM1200mP26_20040 [Acidimicrobiales bacterium]|nr:MAG: hypothetical protein CM1200mP26_20040 [Acidimicrobiales bacterium]